MQTSIQRTLTDDGTATVTVRGDIDFANAADLARCIGEAIAGWSPTLVRVDLREAGLIDSSGLGALIEGYRAALDANAGFLVVDPTPSFRRVLTITGLDDFFLGEAAATGEAAEGRVQATGA